MLLFKTIHFEKLSPFLTPEIQINWNTRESDKQKVSIEHLIKKYSLCIIVANNAQCMLYIALMFGMLYLIYCDDTNIINHIKLCMIIHK